MDGLVIFDVNGLLIESELLIWEAYRQVLARRGIDFSREEFTEDWTRHGYGLSHTLRKHGMDDVDEERIRTEKEHIYHDLIRNSLSLMPGAKKCVARLHGLFSLAIDSSSKQSDVKLALSRFDLLHWFKYIDTKESGFAKKPFPDSLRHICDVLQISPQGTVLLDDAEKGVRAARAAGIKVIAIPNEFTAHNDFSAAHLTVESLHEVTSATIRRVLLEGDSYELAGT